MSTPDEKGDPNLPAYSWHPHLSLTEAAFQECWNKFVSTTHMAGSNPPNIPIIVMSRAESWLDIWRKCPNFDANIPDGGCRLARIYEHHLLDFELSNLSTAIEDAIHWKKHPAERDDIDVDYFGSKRRKLNNFDDFGDKYNEDDGSVSERYDEEGLPVQELSAPAVPSEVLDDSGDGIILEEIPNNSFQDIESKNNAAYPPQPNPTLTATNAPDSAKNTTAAPVVGKIFRFNQFEARSLLLPKLSTLAAAAAAGNQVPSGATDSKELQQNNIELRDAFPPTHSQPQPQQSQTPVSSSSYAGLVAPRKFIFHNHLVPATPTTPPIPSTPTAVACPAPPPPPPLPLPQPGINNNSNNNNNNNNNAALSSSVPVQPPQSPRQQPPQPQQFPALPTSGPYPAPLPPLPPAEQNLQQALAPLHPFPRQYQNLQFRQQQLQQISPPPPPLSAPPQAQAQPQMQPQLQPPHQWPPQQQQQPSAPMIITHPDYPIRILQGRDSVDPCKVFFFVKLPLFAIVKESSTIRDFSGVLTIRIDYCDVGFPVPWAQTLIPTLDLQASSTSLNSPIDQVIEIRFPPEITALHKVKLERSYSNLLAIVTSCALPVGVRTVLKPIITQYPAFMVRPLQNPSGPVAPPAIQAPINQLHLNQL